ncbi:MAG: hypothetical protein IPO91_34220 [Chloroflexi bacterium]|nr:hypothetical protein [Chloroflexota bacterium]
MDGVGDPSPAARIIHEEGDASTAWSLELTEIWRAYRRAARRKTTLIDWGDLTAAVGRRLAIMAARKTGRADRQRAVHARDRRGWDRLVQVVTNRSAMRSVRRRAAK